MIRAREENDTKEVEQTTIQHVEGDKYIVIKLEFPDRNEDIRDYGLRNRYNGCMMVTLAYFGKENVSKLCSLRDVAVDDTMEGFIAIEPYSKVILGMMTFNIIDRVLHVRDFLDFKQTDKLWKTMMDHAENAATVSGLYWCIRHQ